MSVKLRKSVTEKIDEIREQREVHVAILDQFISEAVMEGERLGAIQDSSAFMHSYVEIMQDLNQCYSICVLLTAEMEESIENFNKVRSRGYQSGLVKSSAKDSTVSFRVDLPQSDKTEIKGTRVSEMHLAPDIDKNVDCKFTEFIDVKTSTVSNKPDECAYSSHTLNISSDKSLSRECSNVPHIKDETSVKKGISSTKQHAESKDTGRIPRRGSTESTLQELNRLAGEISSSVHKNLIKVDSKKKVLLDKAADEGFIKKDGMEREENFNFNASSSSKIDVHKYVSITEESVLESGEEKSSKSFSSLKSLRDVPDTQKDTIQSPSMDEYKSTASHVECDPYYVPGKPKLDLEVAQRFLSNIIRQAEKDNQQRDRAESGTNDIIGKCQKIPQSSPESNVELHGIRSEDETDTNLPQKHVKEEYTHSKEDVTSKMEINQIMDASLDSAYQTTECSQVTEKSAIEVKTLEFKVKQTSDNVAKVTEVKVDEEAARSKGADLGGVRNEKLNKLSSDKSRGKTSELARPQSRSPSETSEEIRTKEPEPCDREKSIASALICEKESTDLGIREDDQTREMSETSNQVKKSKGESSNLTKSTSKETKAAGDKVVPEEIGATQGKNNNVTGAEATKEVVKKTPDGSVSSSAVEHSYGKGPELKCATLSPRRIINVIVSEVCSPWLFFIQEWSNLLNHMMEELSKYMTTMLSLENTIVASLQITTPVEGMVCLAKYSKDGCYYRGKVTKVYATKGEPAVNVMYIDYGNREKRKLSHLWELPSRFAELPAQAIPCCLAKVAPSNKYNMWTDNDINCFSRISLGQTFSMLPLHVSSDPEVPSFVELFFNIPQITVVQGKQVLVPGPNQVSVHSLLTSKACSKTVEIDEQMDMVLENLGLSSKKKSLQCKGSACSSRGGSEEKECVKPGALSRSGSVDCDDSKQERCGKPGSRRGSKSETRQDSMARMPRPVSKTEQEKCMSKFDEKGKYVKDIHRPRSSTPVETRGKRSLNDLDPGIGKGSKSGKVSQTVLNITEMKIQNNPKNIHNDNMSTSSSEVGSVHYPGDKEFHAPEKYDVPSNALEVMVSHVNSPNDFYIHPVSKIWGETLSLLMLGLKKQVDQLSAKKVKKMAKNFSPSVGELCCAQFSQDNQYYRALVTGFELASPTKDSKADKENSENVGKVYVFYVDFGDKEVLPKRKVLPLPEEYRDIPGLAIHCSLAYVQPESQGDGQWSKEAVEKFAKLTGSDKALKMLIMLGDITYAVENHPREVVKMPPVQVVLVDYEVKKKGSPEVEEVCVNLELIRQGYANLIKDMQGMREESAALTPERLKIWDPMGEAYLDNRNSYRIDTDDAGMATVGYKQQLDTVCKFYQEGDCWRGSRCTYRHVMDMPGAVTMDQDFVFANFDELTQDDLYPVPGTWVACEVATIISPGHFYIILPWGKKPLDVLEKEKERREQEGEPFHEETLEDLMNSMSQHYEGTKYDGNLLHYAPGEMVAAPFSGDSQWYRARVVDYMENNVEVFFVDFGNKEWVQEKDIRKLEPEFLHLPFQAMECFLVDVQPTGGAQSFSSDAKLAFRDMVDGVTLVAFIRARSLAGCLYVELYDTRGDSDVSVSQSLIMMGLAEEGKDLHSSSSTSGQFSRSSSKSNSQESLILIPG